MYIAQTTCKNRFFALKQSTLPSFMQTGIWQQFAICTISQVYLTVLSHVFLWHHYSLSCRKFFRANNFTFTENTKSALISLQSCTRIRSTSPKQNVFLYRSGKPGKLTKMQFWSLPLLFNLKNNSLVISFYVVSFRKKSFFSQDPRNVKS